MVLHKKSDYEKWSWSIKASKVWFSDGGWLFNPMLIDDSDEEDNSYSWISLNKSYSPAKT